MAKNKKVKLNEDTQVELHRIAELVGEYTLTANLLNQHYLRVLSDALVASGKEGWKLASNGMLPDGTVELIPPSLAEDVIEEGLETKENEPTKETPSK